MQKKMNASGFRHKIEKILDTALPAGSAIVDEGRALAQDITIGRTAFMGKMGVESEVAYKRRCISDKTIMYHAHIGLNSWQTTVEALRLIDHAADKNGFRVDRAGICLDRRMGLPCANRKGVTAETGPMLETSAEWEQVGQVVPIQPHLGDFMIGFPASTANTIHALRAGVTTIGNLSQFFAHEVPMWHDHVTTTVETVRAIALLGKLREKGTLVHSYLEDGYGALFCDCVTVAGWAYLERYIVEELMGAKLAHCIGGLTSDPIKRAGWVFALNRIHSQDCIGSMFYGDTISFDENFTRNSALVGEYLMWDILAQIECPTGHAVHPLPVTEAVRIPSAEEIIEAQTFGRRVEDTARRLHPYIDFSAAYAFADTLATHGLDVFNNALDGLRAAGVDVRDPLQLLFVLKRIGPAVFEEMFGAGMPTEGTIRGRRPVIMTDIFEMSKKNIDQYQQLFQHPENRIMLEGRRLLIASADVHEHAILILDQLCRDAGAATVYLGAEKTPDRIAAKADETRPHAILVSTHNGMALEYAQKLKLELGALQLDVPVIMGGVLNQKIEGEALPVNVAQDIKALGFHPATKLEGKLTHLLHFEEQPPGNS